MSAGRAWALKLRRLLRSQEKKNQQKAEWGREKSTEPNLWLRNGHREQGFHWGFLCPPSAEPHPVAVLPWVGSSKWHFGEWMGQSSAEPLQLPQSCRHSPRVKNLGFLSLSLLALAQGSESPSRLSTIQLFILIHFLERKSKRKKRVHRKLLCSRDTQSWLEGWGWEAKWKSFPDKSLCWLVLWHSASQMKNQKKKTKTKPK